MKRLFFLLVVLALSAPALMAQKYYYSKGDDLYELGYYDSAFHVYNQGMNAGESAAAFRVAYCYLLEIGTPRNVEKALSILEKWSKKDPAICMFTIAFYDPTKSIAKILWEQEIREKTSGNIVPSNGSFYDSGIISIYDVTPGTAWWYDLPQYANLAKAFQLSKTLHSLLGTEASELLMSTLQLELFLEKSDYVGAFKYYTQQKALGKRVLLEYGPIVEEVALKCSTLEQLSELFRLDVELLKYLGGAKAGIHVEKLLENFISLSMLEKQVKYASLHPKLQEYIKSKLKQRVSMMVVVIRYTAPASVLEEKISSAFEKIQTLALDEDHAGSLSEYVNSQIVQRIVNSHDGLSGVPIVEDFVQRGVLLNRSEQWDTLLNLKKQELRLHHVTLLGNFESQESNLRGALEDTDIESVLQAVSNHLIDLRGKLDELKDYQEGLPEDCKADAIVIESCEKKYAFYVQLCNMLKIDAAMSLKRLVRLPQGAYCSHHYKELIQSCPLELKDVIDFINKRISQWVLVEQRIFTDIVAFDAAFSLNTKSKKQDYENVLAMQVSPEMRDILEECCNKAFVKEYSHLSYSAQEDVCNTFLDNYLKKTCIYYRRHGYVYRYQ